MKFMRKIRIGFVGHSYSRGNFGLCALAFGEQAVVERVCAELGVDYDIVCYETGINHPCNDNPKIKLEEYNLRNVFKTAKHFLRVMLFLTLLVEIVFQTFMVLNYSWLIIVSRWQLCFQE